MERSTTDEIRLLLKYMSKGYKVPKILHDIVFDAAKYEIEDKGRVIIVKRDPDIRRGNIQGSYIKVKDGDTIGVHPAAVKPFNADFDGDMMAFFVPLSEEAQKEVKNKMISVVQPGSINSPNFMLSNEMFTGLYTLTDTKKSGKAKPVKTIEEVDELHIGTPVTMTFKGSKRSTTAGRIMFNSFLPAWYPFVDETCSKKEINAILQTILEKNQSDFATTVDILTKKAEYYATTYPQTFSLDMLEVPSKVLKMREKLNKLEDPSDQAALIKEMEKELMKHLKTKAPQLYSQINAGSAKGGDQIRQLMVAKGIIRDAEGNILPPIATSTTEGLDSKDYFDASAGARKGLIDKAVNTGKGGYSFRKLVYVVGNVELNDQKDCATKRGLDIKLTKELYKRLRGRYVVTERGGIAPIDESMIGDLIKLRSPAFCETRRICKICYGDLWRQNRTKNIGVISAQEMNISERIMKCSVGVVQTKDNKCYTLDDLWEGTEWKND